MPNELQTTEAQDGAESRNPSGDASDQEKALKDKEALAALADLEKTPAQPARAQHEQVTDPDASEEAYFAEVRAYCDAFEQEVANLTEILKTTAKMGDKQRETATHLIELVEDDIVPEFLRAINHFPKGRFYSERVNILTSHIHRAIPDHLRSQRLIPIAEDVLKKALLKSL